MSQTVLFYGKNILARFSSIIISQTEGHSLPNVIGLVIVVSRLRQVNAFIMKNHSHLHFYLKMILKC